MKYLEIYWKIVSKARGQAPVAALATAFAHFRKDQNALKYIAYSSQQQGKNQSTTHINIKKKIGTHVFLAFCHCEAYSFAFPLQNVDQLDKRIFHRAVQNRTRRHFQWNGTQVLTVTFVYGYKALRKVLPKVAQKHFCSRMFPCFIWEYSVTWHV